MGKQRKQTVDSILAQVQNASPEQIRQMCGNPAYMQYDRVKAACKRAGKVSQQFGASQEAAATGALLQQVAQEGAAGGASGGASGGGSVSPAGGGSNVMLYAGIGVVAILLIGGVVLMAGRKAQPAA